jgi:7-carboxy-7-deazaguanine synthase
MTTKKFPIAEMFDSVQGEGLYQGTRMFFVRFAGCSVGKRMTAEEREKFGGSDFPVYRETCTLYSGKKFACDTNFQTAQALTMEEIMEQVPKGVERICFTGGEPLNQPLDAFISYIGGTNYKLHLETSGTINFDDVYTDYNWQDNSGEEENGSWIWISVSPKWGALPEMMGIANEIKLLVDEEFDIKRVPVDVMDHRLVWLQPVNDEFAIRKENVERCLALMKEYPNFRLSTQLHKIWGVR